MLRCFSPVYTAGLRTLASRQSGSVILDHSRSPLRNYNTDEREAELNEFRENVRCFAQEQIAPFAESIDRENTFPKEVNLWKEMGDFGLLGITAPEEHGGLNMGYAAHCIAMEELSRASGSVALSYGAHSNLCVNQLVRHATRTQAAKYLPKLISGEHVGALAMSEPGSGSDVVSMRTPAVDDELDQRLHGAACE
ncbi:hypothetical protein CYMTET_16521 [Cymbomonas tetramitiformis]|uniref:Acyl-CoA dehydrogenase/oxidase N-terminal domain-containing protein n=1 Tax=Cymbomonas tetramitiformis TaxID=36881 RepID=A0AAE0L7U7_9CHLO|nr:hypothetical protein CYMTET_16521 [Cymbomonas tetramitiformis]